jgi:D-alanyl-D-alanine carboxypeptidase
VTVYDSEVRAYGQTVADSESARPGFSEHQTGLAMDLSGGGCHIEDCFGDTREGKWVAAHAADYGFIMRYTPANTAETGYRAESWHFRYVGIPLARQIAADPAISLESFFGISGGPNY